MKIYAINISTAKIYPYIENLPFDIQLQIRKFKNIKDALRKLFGELLIRNIIKEDFQIKDETITFCKNEYGKPYLKDHTHFQYNISHSGDWVICGISNKPIGIDIEEVSSIDLSIASTIFSQQELDYMFNQSKDMQTESFFEIWTLKESYIKQMGKGLSFDLNNFSMINNNLCWNIRSTLDTSCLNFYQYDSIPNYKIAVCCEDNNFPNHIIFLSLNNF